MYARILKMIKTKLADLQATIKGREKEFAILVGIALVIFSLLVTGIVLIVKKFRHTPDISIKREVNIPIFPTTLPLCEKEDLVFKTLTNAGYSVAGACGIMGNIAVESPEFDPTVLGPNDIPYGLFQWTDVGDRKQNLRNWCSKHHLEYDTIEGQLAFAIYELSGGDSIAVRLDEYLRTSDDAAKACAEFAAGFERCISDTKDGCGIYNGSLYPEFYGKPYQGLNKRIEKAREYYERFIKAPPQMKLYNTEELDNGKSVEAIDISL